MSDTDVDAAEDLIAHLCGGLAPADRDAFRQAAEAALASSAQCLGPGSIYRTVVPLWRRYFHPPTIPTTTWDQGRLTSALISAPAFDRSRARRRSP